ncbi:MAG TPA: translation initiation factor IF-3 [Acidimicrobiales bacterium]|nr:translation initiation factor IF-3 [Acidimicrobiales bacterium]
MLATGGPQAAHGHSLSRRRGACGGARLRSQAERPYPRRHIRTRKRGLGSHPATSGAPGRSTQGPQGPFADVGFPASASFFLRLRIIPSPHRRKHPPHEGRPAIAAPPHNDEPRINDRIRAREVRLVGADGSQIGIRPLPEALAIARELDLDLVEVADKANPPVCRIMDYGKYKYEAAQKAKESRRKSTNVVIKEMKYRPKIGSGDFDTKTKKVERFLAEGHKVKVTIMFRGREMAHPELGKKILDHVADEVVHLARVEVVPKLDGRNMIMVLAPDKRAQAAHAAKLKEEAEAAAVDGTAPVAAAPAPDAPAPPLAPSAPLPTDAPEAADPDDAPAPAPAAPADSDAAAS